MGKSEPIRLTRAQVREIDRRSIEEYRIPGIVLMENAARGAADVAWEMIDRRRSALVMVVCGGGNNGGDGLAVARHLHNRGAQIEISCVLARRRKYEGDAEINYRIVEAMGLDDPFEKREPPTLIVDAIFGTGLQKPPDELACSYIEMINRSGARVLAIDLPSGLDCDTGEPLGACVCASRTVTFVAEKAGFANPASKQYTGEINVADIGCPRELIEEVSRLT